MCTAITLSNNNHYFGRNLDLEYSLGECVIITPRNYPLEFLRDEPMKTHYSMIGIGIIANNYPLYYDATNEAGLSIAGLNFPGNAAYHSEKSSAHNITPFEFPLWVLGQCKNIEDAKNLLNSTNIVNIPFSNEYQLTPLHWIIADDCTCITVESVSSGLRIYDNPVGVLTNNPPFEYHMQHLCQFLNLTAAEPENRFSDKIILDPYSRGMGSIGLPGDLSSSSRFVRAAFTKLNCIVDDGENSAISQFFHILASVSQTKGCVKIGNKYEQTVYSGCCNTSKGVYYYKTYENSQISCVNMHNEDLDASKLTFYPLINTEQIRMIN